MPEIINAPSPIPQLHPLLFLGGSIEMGSATSWQAGAAQRAAELGWNVLNPRRDGVAPWNPVASDPDFIEQVNWELDGQERADRIVINFLPDTKSPVSLLELGLGAASGKVVIVCPESFWRRGNVELVCQHYNIPLVETLEEALDPRLITSPRCSLINTATPEPPAPGMTESELRDILSLAAPRTWHNYAGDLHFQYQEAVDSMSRALLSALTQRAKVIDAAHEDERHKLGDLNLILGRVAMHPNANFPLKEFLAERGFSSAYLEKVLGTELSHDITDPPTHIGYGPSLELPPTANKERYMRSVITTPSEESTNPRIPETLVEKIAHMIETQPLMPDLSPRDADYAEQLANKVRQHFGSAAIVEKIAQVVELHSFVSEFTPRDPAYTQQLANNVRKNYASDKTMASSTSLMENKVPTYNQLMKIQKGLLDCHNLIVNYRLALADVTDDAQYEKVTRESFGPADAQLRVLLRAAEKQPTDAPKEEPLHAAFTWIWQKRTGELSPVGDEWYIDATYDGPTRLSPHWTLRRLANARWIILIDNQELNYVDFAEPVLAAVAAEDLDTNLRKAASA